MSPVILGVDPGSRYTGFGVVQGEGNQILHLASGSINPGSRPPLESRLCQIFDGLSELIRQHCPQAIALEEIFLATNVHSAFVLGQVRGVVLLLAARSMVPIFHYSPLVVKKAVVGYGRASKTQVQTDGEATPGGRNGQRARRRRPGGGPVPPLSQPLAGRLVMIGYLEGQLIDKSPNQIMVKVGGVGYRIFIPLSTFYALPEPPAAVALQIHTRMQEDALHLYGFNTLEEKDVFLQLLSIPRVGAKTALNILSGINPEDFAQALLAGDDKRLAGIPGIGKKSAARIVLELKDKLPTARRPRPASAGEKLMQDALSALLNLGYPKNLAEKALEAAKALGAGSLEDLLRQSLKSLAK